MNNFRRQQLRGGFVTTITALLLVVSVAFSIIGYAASDGTAQQIEAIETRYTTIATMNDQDAQLMYPDGTFWYSDSRGGLGWRNKNYTILDNGSIQWEDGSIFYSANVLEEVAKDAPQVRTIAHSAILSAHVDGIYGLTSGTQNRLQFNEAFDSFSYNMAVVVGKNTTTNMTERRKDEGVKTLPYTAVEIEGEEGIIYLCYAEEEFSVKNAISMHPTYAALLKRNNLLSNEHGRSLWILTDPEEEEMWQGKQYIVRFFIRDLPVVQVEKEENGQVTYAYRKYSGFDDPYKKHFGGRYNVELGRTFTYTYRDLFSLEGFQEQKGVGQKNFILDMKTFKKDTWEVDEDGWLITYESDFYYYALPDDSLPFYAEFEGSLEDFLNSEEGQVWRDVIIPMAEINQHSATVMLVDDLNYLHAFNSGKAMIIEGRKIDPAEFIKGDKVCVVSAAYADYAGLEVGDTINLDYYDTGYFLSSATIENWDSSVGELAMTHNPLQESNRIGYEADYTIVGIYSAPEYEFGATSFYADTIFVPKASVPNAEEYENPSLPLLNFVVLMNGTTDEFEEYMESQGFGGYYNYFEQDYSSTLSGLNSLSQNALRLVILAGAVFFVTAILFYYLNFKRMIPVAYGMRRMGQHPFKLWWQMEMVTIPVILIAVFGGAYLGVYFFEYVTLKLFETNIIMDIQTVKWLTYLEAAALCAISLLVAIPISVPRLMKRK